MLDHTCRQLRPNCHVSAGPALTQTRLARATEAARAIVDQSRQSGSDHFADQKRITIVVPSSAGCERSRSTT